MPCYGDTVFIVKRKTDSYSFLQKLKYSRTLIVQPTLFSPIIQYVVLANAESIDFEMEDNFQKQTYRNRYVIYGANGEQTLTVPIMHRLKGAKLKTKDIKIDYSTDWCKLHIRSLQSAYRSSPFYEFYEDDILLLFYKKHKYLIDLNLDSFDRINECLQVNFNYKKTNEYQQGIDKDQDYRFLANAKSKQHFILPEYTQVFDDKHGFIPNLSILDLIFNEGPNALMYLESSKKIILEN